MTRYEDSLISSIDRKNAKPAFKPEPPHPKLASLDEAWKAALIDVTPGALFRWCWKRMDETWAAARPGKAWKANRKDRRSVLKEAEQHFSNSSVGSGAEAPTPSRAKEPTSQNTAEVAE